MMVEQQTSNPITQTYEQPLNERVRLLLRLESVFGQAIAHQKAEDQYQTQMCLDALFSLLNLTNRYELRAEVLKELERIRSIFKLAEKADAVSSNRLAKVQEELSDCAKTLHGLDSKHIDRIRNIEFLNIIKQRNIHDTGSYVFEVPVLQYWLLQDSMVRQQQVERWINDFLPFKKAIDFLLRLIRESAVPSDECAENGIFLKTIDSKKGYHQLLRVDVSHSYNVFPKISGGKHRFAIRFMEQNRNDLKTVQTSENVRFRLQTCMI